MLHSPIDNEEALIRTESPVALDITHFVINGPTVEIEGYASVEGLKSYSEDRIRKLLLIRPTMDIEAYREEHMYDEKIEELSDDEIIELHTIKIPLDNCPFKKVKNYKSTNIKDLDSLGGFRATIDLSVISNGKPLEKGDYHLFIRLEQLMDKNDNIKYVKTVPLANIKDLIGNKMLTTHLHYYSASLIMRYNLMVTFDPLHKTLRFENKLLQSYNPQEFSSEDGVKVENRYVLAIKKRLFKLFYYLFYLLPVSKKKITFASDSRTDLSGNLYFIYEELYRRNMGLNI